MTVIIVGMMEKKYQNPKFFDQKDTEELVATYTYGRGLTPLTTTPRRPEVMNQQMNQQRMNQNAPIGGGPMGNMPGIYNNIVQSGVRTQKFEVRSSMVFDISIFE